MREPDELEDEMAVTDYVFRGRGQEPPPGLWPKIRRRQLQRQAVEAARRRIRPERAES